VLVTNHALPRQPIAMQTVRVELADALPPRSVTLERIDDDHANHLNLGAVWNPLAFIARGFRSDDRIWPRCVELTAKFLRSDPRL